jgi:hypothetical protein
MCYNFDFLKKEDKYKDFTYACIEAEKSLVVSYASTIMGPSNSETRVLIDLNMAVDFEAI